MRNTKRQIAPSPKKSSTESLDVQSLLGPAPLLDGEDPVAYAALLDHVRNTVEPADAIEEIWVRDLVDLLWETLRLRRLKVAYMRAAAPEGLEIALRPVVKDGLDRSRLVTRWAARDPAAVRDVKTLLKKRDFDETNVISQTLALKLDAFERFDRLIAQSEARRNAVLREVDKRRDMAARRLRLAADVIEDAEFTDLGALPPRMAE